MLAVAGDLSQRIALYLAAHAALFALYGAAVWLVLARPERAPGIGAVLLAAVVFRAILLPAAPALSDDLYRYIWEGRVQLHGFNPWEHPPDDPVLAGLRDPLWEKINNKDLPAIYPPLAQWACALGALAGPSTTMMKLVFVVADLLLCFVLARLLRARGQPAVRALVYAWNPLVVTEVAGSGHNDSLAMLFVAISVLVIIERRPAGSMLALGAAALSKLFPLALLAFFIKRVRPAWLLLPPAMLVAGYIPYGAAGAGLFQSSREFAQRWRGHESLFLGVESAIAASGISGPLKDLADARGWPSLYTQPHMLARGAAALLALAALTWLARRCALGSLDLPEAIAAFTGIVLLLSPVLHPWYLIWILPWMALTPMASWLTLSFLAAAFHAAMPGWMTAAVYTLFFVLLVVELARPPWRARM